MTNFKTNVNHEVQDVKTWMKKAPTILLKVHFNVWFVKLLANTKKSHVDVYIRVLNIKVPKQ